MFEPDAAHLARKIVLAKPIGPLTEVTVRLPRHSDLDHEIPGTPPGSGNFAKFCGLPIETALKLDERDVDAVGGAMLAIMDGWNAMQMRALNNRLRTI